MPTIREEVTRVVRSRQAEPTESAVTIVSCRLVNLTNGLRVAAAEDAAQMSQAAMRGDTTALASMAAKLSKFANNAPEEALDAAVELAFECMTPLQKKIIELREGHDMSYMEIAKALSLKPRQVAQSTMAAYCLANRAIDVDAAANAPMAFVD